MGREADIETRRTIPRWIDQPLFTGVAELLDGADAYPSLDELNRRLSHAPGANELRFAAQTTELQADGLHYEERIARHGVISTREGNPHDLFNALVWLRHAPIKRAMNTRQVADIARVGRKQRTRGQCALTHFDEAGAIVWIASRELLAAWDAHDWKGLYAAHTAEWGNGIAITMIGHALYEYALVHGTMPVAKALAVEVDASAIALRCENASTISVWPEAEQFLAAEIAAGRVLADPQELRPLPLAGIPGWHAGAQPDDFFETSPCFRPLRAGRRYPSPMVLEPRVNRKAEPAGA